MEVSLQTMQAYQELSQAGSLVDTVLTIGVFDGVHRGHRHLIQMVREVAAVRSCRAAVITFYNHPRSVLYPNDRVTLLNLPEERVRLLEEQQVDLVLPITFDLELSRLRAREFCKMLQQKLGMCALVIGPNFSLGFQREGTPEVLHGLGQEMGFIVQVVDPVEDNGEMVSSTGVRQALDRGDVSTASRYLGYPFTVEGLVVHGEGRGRNIGFPTANLEVSSKILLPGNGVYATWAHLENNLQRWKSATNIGVNPTFGEGHRTVEAFLIGYEGDLYDQHIRLEFAERLRDERRFDSVETLTGQIKEDVRRAVGVLERTEEAGGSASLPS